MTAEQRLDEAHKAQAFAWDLVRIYAKERTKLERALFSMEVERNQAQHDAACWKRAADERLPAWLREHGLPKVKP